MSRFPKGCWDKDCKYFKVWDISTDDLCCEYELLEKQCDHCDEDWCLLQCPLEDNRIMKKNSNKKNRVDICMACIWKWLFFDKKDLYTFPLTMFGVKINLTK